MKAGIYNTEGEVIIVKRDKISYWAPRLLALVLIGFMALLSLDVFDMDVTAGKKALGLLIHNIPTIVLAIILAVAWKREMVGAAGFLALGIAWIGFIIGRTEDLSTKISMSLTLGIPAFLISFLFYHSYKKNR